MRPLGVKAQAEKLSLIDLEAYHLPNRMRPTGGKQAYATACAVQPERLSGRAPEFAQHRAIDGWCDSPNLWETGVT
jgi:hypothetical protein